MFADAWGVDAIYSGSQKCLSAPPGASPLMFSERAVAKLQGRKTKPATYNLDMNLIGEVLEGGEVCGGGGGGVQL
jgi:alanine-glyoxylate transaminase/serine-glyoxylate transaminase/serine-pyruvate transaminase